MANYVIRVFDVTRERGEHTVTATYDLPFSDQGSRKAEKILRSIRPSAMARAGNPAQDASFAAVVDTETGLAVHEDDGRLYSPVFFGAYSSHWGISVPAEFEDLLTDAEIFADQRRTILAGRGVMKALPAYISGA